MSWLVWIYLSLQRLNQLNSSFRWVWSKSKVWVGSKLVEKMPISSVNVGMTHSDIIRIKNIKDE